MNGRPSWWRLNAAIRQWSKAVTEPLTLNNLTRNERTALLEAYHLMVEALDNDKE